MTIVEAKPCECGCGMAIPLLDKKGRPVRFVVGHNMRGRTLSNEARKKLSEARKGKALSGEHRKKLAESHKGKPLAAETKQKMSWSRMGKRLSESTRQKIGEAARLRYQDSAERQKTAAALMGHSVSETFRKRMSEAIGELWRNPDYANRQSRAIIAGGTVRPNRAELALLNIVSPLNFCYVGDGNLIIDRKNPDFTDGNNHLIELFGNYWHKDQSPDDRISFFAERGWKCLVIWEMELDSPEAITERVKSWLLH